MQLLLLLTPTHVNFLLPLCDDLVDMHLLHELAKLHAEDAAATTTAAAAEPSRRCRSVQCDCGYVCVMSKL